LAGGGKFQMQLFSAAVVTGGHRRLKPEIPVFISDALP
jgi:hypothetical protein